MASFTPNLELRQQGPNDPIDPVEAFAANFGKVSTLFMIGSAPSQGVAVCDRRNATGTISHTSGDIHFSYFTSYRGSISGGIVSKVEMRLGPQGATGLTLARVGLYTVNAATQQLTLVASTSNDTTGWSGAYSTVTKNLTGAYTLAVGQRYALGTLFIGTTPTSYTQANGSSDYGLNALPPRLCGKLTGQTDLPSTVNDTSLQTTGAGPFAILLP